MGWERDDQGKDKVTLEVQSHTLGPLGKMGSMLGAPSAMFSSALLPKGCGQRPHQCYTCHSQCLAGLPHFLAHILHPGSKFFFWEIWKMH